MNNLQNIQNYNIAQLNVGWIFKMDLQTQVTGGY